MPDALFCACNYWGSPGHVGSHHLARCLLERGWRVAFVSDPVSPLHLLGGLSAQLRERLKLHRSGGRWVEERLWTWVPGALCTPNERPLLRSWPVQRHWSAMAWPDPARVLARAGFEAFDLVYVDSIAQGYWWRGLRHGKSVFRLADNPAGFSSHTPAAQRALESVARFVDALVYSAPHLAETAASLGAKQSALLLNGVDNALFSQPAPRPAEYEDDPRPVVLYAGVLKEWFHFQWLRQAAAALPRHRFVVVGPEGGARHRLDGLSNVRLLGPRPHASLPAYMQHAAVGVIPFDVATFPDLVHGINPLKLYEYMASGLPVVATRWRTLEELGSPAVLVDSAREFIEAIANAAAPPVAQCQRFAADYDWQPRLEELLKLLNLGAS
ncbi:MAG TPA: glycosyltransferase [Humidesulfovibrio sp.]|uniref:glycosyltransferase n=1 Tax=Humidesulfovibrio sp. TaxID=2910988 RepID=UPI002BAED3B3|nr:glycosyltransferase [Humidesulfovibrio sp.]HWR02671.1 glycosyltransferase [Humidesulfovibrio sp.]